MAYKYINTFADLAAAKAATGLLSPHVAKIGNQFVFVNAGSNVPIVFQDNNEFAVVISNEWNPIYSNRKLRVIIQGEVVLNGKVDCYSIEFAQGGHLTINPDARLRIWEGGIVNADAESVNYFTIHEYLHENIYGEFLLHPNLTVNNHPMATVSMHVSKGNDADNNHVWTRFITPMLNVSGWTKVHGYGTWIMFYDRNKEQWVKSTSWNELKPFYPSFILTYDEKTEEIFSFTSNIVGNSDTTLNLTSDGYWTFGNSYLGKMSVYKFVLEKFPTGYNNIQRNTGTKEDMILIPIIEGVKANPLEIFSVQLRGRTSESCSISYKDLVWDPSFEEDTTSIPTRGLKSSPKSELILPDSPIFSDPIDAFADIDNSNLK